MTGESSRTDDPATAMTVWIDTDAAVRVGRTWNLYADEMHRRAFELERHLVELALGEHLAVVQHLTAGATELWVAATVVRLAADAASGGDQSFDVADRHDVARLVESLRTGGGRYSSAFGDRGGTGEREMRSPYLTAGSTSISRARGLLVRALTDTADERQIRPDEFEVVRLDNGRYVVVLPGVVDLSGPDPGWHDHHRSVRDIDRAAFRSSRSTLLEDNPYARSVRDGLARAGVPTGSELLLVGHSFGADTALDLAADAGFNGSSGYRVTHVVAAGYHSGPQLPAVPGSTAVLVLQNRRDVPVIVEAIGEAHVRDAVVEQAGAVADALDGRPLDAARHQVTSLGHQLGALRAAARHLVVRADDVARAAVGVTVADPRRVADGLSDLLTLEPGVRSPAPGQVVSVFDGGGEGFGHRQAHYVAHVRTVDDPAVIAFLASVDRAGYTDAGTASAVDVSVPES